MFVKHIFKPFQSAPLQASLRDCGSLFKFYARWSKNRHDNSKERSLNTNQTRG